MIDYYYSTMILHCIFIKHSFDLRILLILGRKLFVSATFFIFNYYYLLYTLPLHNFVHYFVE